MTVTAKICNFVTTFMVSVISIVQPAALLNIFQFILASYVPQIMLL